MTDSNSDSYVQTIGPCDFCYKDNIVQWKCFHCEKYLCKKCTLRHLKEFENSEHQAQELFGSNQNVSTVRSKFRLEVSCTLTTNLPIIHQVIPLSDTTAWISSNLYEQSVIEIIKIKGNNIKTLKQFCLSINAMARTSDNGILFTEFGHSGVNMITNSGEINTFVTVAPLFPRGIHVTNDNKVLIGVKDPEGRYTLTDLSKRAVMVFNMNGKQHGLYQYDKNNKRLFTLPNRITTNNNQDILVIDSTSNGTGRVVTLDREGNLKWIYSGIPLINGSKKFRPRDITTTETGYIIVSNFRTHTLHVLSENGEVLTCQVMNDARISHPLGLNIDRGGRLWLTCGTGGRKSGAKIHIIKFLQNQPEDSM